LGQEERTERRALEKGGKGGNSTWDERRGQRGEREIDLGQEERIERRGTGVRDRGGERELGVGTRGRTEERKGKGRTLEKGGKLT
jgi:hypothetical protein